MKEEEHELTEKLKVLNLAGENAALSLTQVKRESSFVLWNFVCAHEIKNISPRGGESPAHIKLK